MGSRWWGRRRLAPTRSVKRKPPMLLPESMLLIRGLFAVDAEDQDALMARMPDRKLPRRKSWSRTAPTKGPSRKTAARRC